MISSTRSSAFLSDWKMKLLFDRYQRVINYLRISITDRCNLRCRYCQDGRMKLLPHSEILTYEEILRIVRVFTANGIRKVRLTGGEPLVRRGVVDFIKRLTEIEGLDDISLTTNGVLLREFAAPLKKAGLRRVNVSLDTLRRERFAYITRRDHFNDVWEGIEEALRVGLFPVKVNVVVIRGFNDDEIEDFARLSMEHPLGVRFIELMPFGGEWDERKVVPTFEIEERLRMLGDLVPLPRMEYDGPARRYRIRGGRGEVGFISPMSAHFCKSCNRLRLTPEGKIRTCLFSDDEIDLRQILRSGAEDEAIEGALKEALKRKPESPPLEAFQFKKCQRGMFSIGG